MLRIRLRRTGAKKQPRYRVVVAESSAPRDGAFVEILGWYNPQADPAQIVIDSDKVSAWIGKGARPSESVAHLIRRAEAARTAAEAAKSEPEPAAKRPARRRTAKTEAPAEAAEPAAVQAEAEPAASEPSAAAS